jgi:choline dehydrogenase
VASGLPGIPLTKGFSSGPALIRPHSRGRLTMMSANPGSSLHIDPNFLAEESDLDALSAGVEACTRLGLSRALVQWRAASVRVAPSDKTKLREVIKSNIVTYNHPVGTCAMGMGTRAVVDSSLCVHGISNLRVADGSIMPNITTGNPLAATLVIAERAADMMLAERVSRKTVLRE